MEKVLLIVGNHSKCLILPMPLTVAGLIVFQEIALNSFGPNMECIRYTMEGYLYCVKEVWKSFVSILNNCFSAWVFVALIFYASIMISCAQ